MKTDRRLMENKSFENIVIFCENRESSLELEDFLHKQDWKWSDGRKYHIKTDTSINGVVLTSFDFERKMFTGYEASSKPSNKRYVVYDYSQDKSKIRNFFQKSPTYLPRKTDRRLMENYKSKENFRIYSEDRNTSVELEDFLHKLGWKYNDGNTYYIRKNTDIAGVLLHSFDFDKKLFNGSRSRTAPTDVNYMYNYKNDKYQITKFFQTSPNYNPKRINRNILDENKSYSDDLLLEKSSLTRLGVPREVMQSLQKDFAIPPDAEWERVRLKRDAEKIIRTGEREFLLQIELDSIKTFVSYSISGMDKYFVDSYVMDEGGWGGYEKQPREEVTITQLLYQINPRSILYQLKSPFSIVRQPKRKLIKKEKNFVEFTENFKKDFLNNFDSILKRIVGSKYKDAKKEIQDKARQMEMENKMMLSGLDDPLQGPNSLTLLDQFITEFEESYSDFFGERLDIEELSKYFSREKMMTSFMYYIYTGKLLSR